MARMMRKVGGEKARAVLVAAAVSLLVLLLVGLAVLWRRGPSEQVVEGGALRSLAIPGRGP